MPKVRSVPDGHGGFRWERFLLSAVVIGWSVAAPLRAQDDAGAVPNSDVQQAVAPDANAVPPPGNDMAPPSVDQAPDDSASFQNFYDSLANQGTWIQSSDYGYVWQPQVNDPNWAPYTDGYWVYSDDGWTWVSNEPWGWATYHYGRWVNLDGVGWCWVPGYVWAPAWVSWRYGDGYCGWAPLPPDSFLGIDYSEDGTDVGAGFHIGADCDAFYGIGPACYCFVPVNSLGYRNYRGYYRNRADNFALINRTTNMTNINVARNGNSANFHGAGTSRRVTTGGPELAQVNDASQTPIQKVTLARTNRPGGGGTLTGGSLAFYAPHVNPIPKAQPALVSATIGVATINRGTDVMQPLAVNSRLAPAAATETQVEQARTAQSQAPAGAKVMTDNNESKSALHAPLTSMSPMAGRESPSSRFGAAPYAGHNSEQISSNAGGAPTARIFPENRGGVPSRTYYPAAPQTPAPHSSVSGTGGASESRSFVPPPAPAVPPQGAAASRANESETSAGGGNATTHTSTGGGAAAGGTPQGSGNGWSRSH